MCGIINLENIGIQHGSCIDGKLIKSLFNISKDFSKDKNQCKECLCVGSVDMGIYNTCKFQCSYCYANYSEKSIRNNWNRHKPNSASIINEYPKNIEIIKDKSSNAKNKSQLTMFTGK